MNDNLDDGRMEAIVFSCWLTYHVIIIIVFYDLFDEVWEIEILITIVIFCSTVVASLKLLHFDFVDSYLKNWEDAMIYEKFETNAHWNIYKCRFAEIIKW